MANMLFILNDPPYGTERSYNALRLARHALKKGEERETVRVFLMGDAASCARGGPIGVCGTCMDARGITEAELVEGSHRSTMDELTAWTLEADKVIVF